ncbi:hypothetical protein [Spiroplasma mirum]|uniref:hypothetical protein n=1 Tax=Spiroplasma mirum TaxID=2144 RepID=UPI0003DFD479|nr:MULTISPECIES: hypothetical protein [Spiroplasma]AHF61365.1 hypothetical protein SMM_0989 [Spiroplasma mirum ATCC 29335]
MGEPSSTNKNSINLDSFIFNFCDSKEAVEQLSIDDFLKVENRPETNWPQEIDELEKRTRKLLEKKMNIIKKKNL